MGEPTGAAAFLWEDGELTTILPIDDYHASRASDINESGQITGRVDTTDQFGGQRAFLWENGNVVLLPPLVENEINSESKAISKDMFLAGGSVVPARNEEDTITRGFLWDQELMLNLGVLPGFQRSSALALQDNHLVGGWCWDPVRPSNPSTAVLWHADSIYDMQPLIKDNSSFDLKGAVDFNSQEHVLVSALDSGNDTVAAILEPVDPPSEDITGDCAVNVFDLIVLLDNWDHTDSFADIDDNGVVNVSDLLLLLSNWGS